MSALTMAQFLATEQRPFETAANAWQGLADQLDDAAEQMIRGTRDLEWAWSSGPAARAATDKTNRLRAELNNTYSPAREISQALAHHGAAAAELRQQARQLIEAANRNGIVADLATGQMILAPYVGDRAAAARKAQRFVDELAALLDRARQLDDNTTKIINANVPDLSKGFGQTSPAAVSRQDVESQRGRHPRDVNTWWRNLTPQQQEQAIQDHPELVGSLDGVPAVDRDTANRMVLDRQQTALEQRRAELQAQRDSLIAPGNHTPGLPEITAEMKDIDAKLAGLQKIEDRLNRTGDQPAYLLGIDANAGQSGRVILAVGDPDSAGNIATYVPGTTSNLRDPGELIQRTDVMVDDATVKARSANTSVVLWLGYEAPQSIAGDASRDQFAEDVRDSGDLRRFQDGLRATHEGERSRNTVLGHSYGTTVIGYTARQAAGIDADQVVLVASPGIGVDYARDLHLRPDGMSEPDPGGNVWVTTAPTDIIRTVPDVWYGNAPTDGEFGGRQFDSDNRGLNPVGNHSGYWDQGNSARNNFAYIITGQTEQVTS